MWLSDLSIKRPVFITMVMVALVVVGLIAYNRIPVDLFPDVSVPTITIRTQYLGAGPEIIEAEVTKPIEDVVSPLSGVKRVESTSSEGLSVITVEY
jgi:HAE1 family hydrophobic/amphiphilic exporter-1